MLMPMAIMVTTTAMTMISNMPTPPGTATGTGTGTVTTTVYQTLYSWLTTAKRQPLFRPNRI